ncbi:MAG TPA: polyphosphate kinase 1 [Thermoanaerobaculia bacterium]|nr:polyphosphate kinase 1 [Thermoanaerobaculia bacterium]
MSPSAPTLRRRRKRSRPSAPVATELFNRELSWLEFNRRVLAEAEERDVPLLERVKFLSIAATNLDEFLMVRLGAVRTLVAGNVRERSPDGLTPRQQLKQIRTRVKAMQRDFERVYTVLLPQLRAAGIRIEQASALTKKQRLALAGEFHARIAPILTPLAFDPGHPLPFLSSGALNLAVTLSAGSELHTAFLKVPKLLPRFVGIPGSPTRFLPVEALIRAQVAGLFPGLEIREVVPFRVLRNADILLREDEVEDLLKSVETGLRKRDRKEVVWMEISAGASAETVELLQRELHVAREDIYSASAPLKLGDVMDIYARAGDKPTVRDEPFNPRMPVELATNEDIFSIIRKGDILLHRPYDSYNAVVELVESSADDPEVVAIKQTLYRTEPGSRVVDALARAALKGKQVTAVVEVQARFDEERNIAWARQLEEAGVQVVYGLVGIKTHSKLLLVIRREGGALRRYVHLSTGNYNARTARLYTDLDLLTCDPEMGEDAAQLMNLITGYGIGTVQEAFENQAGRSAWRRLIVAPVDYHRWALRMIEREMQHARDGKPAQIIAKMNALVEPQVIAALGRAATAGVRIDLIVRGICCLVPRENIRVLSIVDRFLEHSRIFLFRNAGSAEIYVTSGDWMPRNFFRRVEVTWPVLSPHLRDRIEHQILATCLADDVKSWRLQPDGSYRRRKTGAHPLRSQQRFIEIARAEAVKIDPAVPRRKVKRKK